MSAILSMFIPLTAIVMGVGIGMLALWLDYRKKRDFFELYHKERMAAIDKGLELPPLPVELLKGSRVRTPLCSLRRGLIFLLVGAAIAIALYIRHRSAAAYGLIPMAVGVAELLSYWLQGRKQARDDRTQQK